MHRPDGEDPQAQRAGDVHTEEEDQDRVDLHVEACPDGRRRAGAPGDAAVHRVERQSYDGERRQHAHRDGVHEGIGDQGRHASDENGPQQRHQIGRPQYFRVAADQCVRQQPDRQRRAAEADQPAGHAHADRAGEHREDRSLGDQPGQYSLVNLQRGTSVP